MESKLSKWCNGFIEAGWLAAVIGAPLFFNIHSERVFEPDKLTLVRSIALLMAVAWLVRFIDTQGWRDLDWLRPKNERSIWRMPFVLPILALTLVYLLATLFSVVPHVSWAGSYQRLQGTYTTLAYITIFALTATTIRRGEQVQRLVTTVIITSIPIALYGMIQHFGLDPLPWGGNVQRRIAGHMGNAIFIAAYLIMAAPLTLVRIIDAFTNILNEEEFSYADVIRSAIYIFTLAIQLMAIYWSGSRGPLLGLLVGIFALLLILLVSLRNATGDSRRFSLADAGRAILLVLIGLIAGFLALSLLTGLLFDGAMTSFVAFVGSLIVVVLAIFVMIAIRRGWRWLWFSWLLLTAIGGLWLALFNIPPEQAASYSDVPVVGNVLATMEEWRTLPTVGRFGSILEADEGTGRVRVLIWQGALELLAPHDPLVYPDGSTDRFNFLRPLIGYGPESMYVAYNRFYQPELASIEARNASPDRSHNETFDALIITGLAGFLAWQVLYLSVFYFGFRWLGVVRSKRDRNVLIGLWIAGAALAGLIISQQLGAVYLGVAIPFGSIAGLVLYLIYYALFARASGDEAQDPFQADRLLMMGLLAAVVAHYVEIHFGIAVAATRVHFFVYVALMFLVGYLLPRRQEEALVEVENAPAGRRRRRRSSSSSTSSLPGWAGAVAAATYSLTLILGILGYEFMNYVLTKELQTIEDVPGILEIIHQAWFINPSKDFANSPFIFLVIVLTWALGTLLCVAEMARQGIINIPAGSPRSLPANRQRTVTIIFGLLTLASLATVIVRRSGGPAPDTTAVLGLVLLLVWGALCLVATFLLVSKQAAAPRLAGIVALLGLLGSLPVLVAGSLWYGLAVLLAGAIILYLLRDSAWREDLLPAGIIAATSFLISFTYSLAHAALIRASFIGPQLPAGASEVERQVMVADRYTGLLTFFYLFAFSLIILVAFFITQSDPRPTRATGTPAGFAALAALFILGFFLVNTSNMRIVQADMVYKRARPLERLARNNRTPEAWDFPIGIYERAIELAPSEDFYYLFLGAAYLEKSAVTQDLLAQTTLLETARDRLLAAQKINPLNTDHTANLARLTTRWAGLSSGDPAQQADLVAQAEAYYRGALDLSPQNSTLWNEYANLQLTLGGDCEGAIRDFQHSLELDPSYAITYLSLAGAYQTCAAQLATPEEKADFFGRAADLVIASLEVDDRNRATYMQQAAELYRRAAQFERALDLLNELRNMNDPTIQLWALDLEAARVYRSMGDLERARFFAEQALATAPAGDQPTIQQFLDRLESGGDE